MEKGFIKTKVYKTCVRSAMCYGAEGWTLLLLSSIMMLQYATIHFVLTRAFHNFNVFIGLKC